MKTKILLVLIVIFFTPVISYSQINVSSTGKVGLNKTSPSYQLDVSGDLRVSDSGDDLIFENGDLYPDAGSSSLGTYSYMWDYLYAYEAYFYYYETYYSDKRLKTDIKDLDSSIDKLLALRPVKYKMKDKENIDKSIEDSNTEIEQMGLIAQEVQEIFPEIVTEDKEGILGIRYTALIPILIKAFKEQQEEIEDLKSRLEKLESKL